MDKLSKFIEKSILIHGDKYDYSKVEYNGSDIKVTIICKMHGEFLQKIYKHLNGQGCKKCGFINSSLKQKDSSTEFMKKALIVHNDTYDYSKVQYFDSKKKVIIICKTHGEFIQQPNNHLQGNGCPNCRLDIMGKWNKQTRDDFISKSIKVHGDKYDYSKVEYNSSDIKVIIICKIHGEFLQDTSSHVSGVGCPECGKVSRSLSKRKTIDKFINESNHIHNNEYDYSKTEYINTNKDIIIICKIHGEFKQTPHSHLDGHGCNLCAYIRSSEKQKYTIDDFIQKSITVHGYEYDYSKIHYTGIKDDVIIICKKHGDFLQKPRDHLRGGGCKKCNPNYSKSQIKWLKFIQIKDNIIIQHGGNDGEYHIPETNYKADGYCKETNTIYEFHGDFWHGNPYIFKNDTFNPICKKTFGELYQITCEREKIIKDLGYKLIVMWENKWKRINKSFKILQKQFRKYKKLN